MSIAGRRQFENSPEGFGLRAFYTGMLPDVMQHCGAAWRRLVLCLRTCRCRSDPPTWNVMVSVVCLGIESGVVIRTA